MVGPASKLLPTAKTVQRGRRSQTSRSMAAVQSTGKVKDGGGRTMQVLRGGGNGRCGETLDQTRLGPFLILSSAFFSPVAFFFRLTRCASPS